MVDIAKAKKSLEDYFENVTKEQFTTDLKKFCPELFEKEKEAQNDSTEPTLLDTKLEGLEHTEIDRHEKTD
jgi:hypothetical protein